jgi:hypothetical protein
VNHEQPSPADLDRHDLQQDPVPVGSEKDESWIQQARSGWCGLSEDDSRLLDNVPAALATDAMPRRGSRVSDDHDLTVIVSDSLGHNSE